MSATNEETNQVERLVMPDYKQLCDKFTEVVATQLHYFERVDGVNLNTATCEEIQEMQSGAVARYLNDYVFHAKVKSMVAALLKATQDERDLRVAEFGGELGRFKIIEA